MKKFFIFILSLLSFTLAAQDYGQDETVKIWNNKTAPHSNGLTTPETDNNHIIGSVTEAELYIFKADPKKATGQAIVICPGGGYSCICISYEGYEMAQWLASEGITCGVLKYRLPNGHKEVPLEDAVEALRTMRKKAADLRIDPKKVGIMGFSAGGHLAGYASTFAADADKPNFAILYYPVISSDPKYAHGSTFNNLLGADVDKEVRAAYSLEKCVTKTTPPTLLLVSDQDQIVPSVNSAFYYIALKEHGVAASMHIFPEGFHGWGNRTDFKYLKFWREAVIDWLGTL